MSVDTEIEIAATPAEVREALLDFGRWPEMKIDLIRTIERIPKDKTGEIEKGEKLSVSFKGMISQVTVLENTSKEFRWRGDLLYVLSGEHYFKFEPSTKNPGRTRLINVEIFKRLNTILMPLTGPEKTFNQLNEELKAGIESRINGVKADQL